MITSGWIPARVRYNNIDEPRAVAWPPVKFGAHALLSVNSAGLLYRADEGVTYLYDERGEAPYLHWADAVANASLRISGAKAAVAAAGQAKDR